MDHGRLRHAQRTRYQAIELGNEPPLSVDGQEGGLVDRRRVSVQWFSGTILTGLCGAALMGGAVFASLDGETNFATVPERIEAALRGAFGNDRVGLRKSDRLPPVVEPDVARRIIQVSVTTRVGDREVVRVRPFVRVAGNLALSTTELSANIPPFNPQKLLAESGPAGIGSEETPVAAPDGEVSFVTRDLAAILPRARIAHVQPIEDVMARVREAANWTGGVRNNFTLASADPSIRLSAYAPTDIADPYAGFEARIVPENITLLPKTSTQSSSSWNERVIAVKKGETIGSILKELGATDEEIKAIAAVLGPRGRDGGLREGHKLRVLLAPAMNNPQRLQPFRVIVAGESAVEAVVALSDLGRYVSVDVNSINSGTETADAGDDQDDGSGVRLYQSIYETALRNQVPRPVIDEMIRVYSYDVDFQRKVQPGDSFEVLYAGDEGATGDGRGEVLFASLTIGGETKKFYRFHSPDDGMVDYYDETGKSAKKFLVRKPLATGIMRSSFGVRRHPILGYMKMHTGIDWSAPHGTPIYASGNGVVEKVGWESGYGKYVRIRHANGYETAYGHMTAFARGIEVGERVRQGQVIGFVGSTGLSTGPHLHYEILVNGRFVDPMRIRLPRGRVLEGQVLATFEKERDRLDAMMSRNPVRTAEAAAPQRR